MGVTGVGGLFGTEFQKFESLTVSTTTSTVFQTKISATTTNFPPGVYRFGVYYGWNHDSITSDFEARLMVDGQQRGEIHKQEPQNDAGTFGSTGTDQRHYLGRVVFVGLAGGTHTVELEFRTDTGGVASSIWDAVVELWRVPGS